MKTSWKKRLLAAGLAEAMMLSGAVVWADNDKEEPVTIKWIVAGDETSATQDAVAAANELLLERYNLELDVQMVSMGNYSDKMNMMINAGEEWDICFTTATWLNIYLDQVAKGAFLDLTPYEETNPGLIADMPEYVVDSCRVNGQLFALPNYQVSVATQGVAVRKDILDEMEAAGIEFDLSETKNTYDLVPVFEYVKENHPELYPASQMGYLYGVPEEYEDYINIVNEVQYTGEDRLIDRYLEWTPEEQMENKYGPYYTGMVNREYWEKGYYREDIATMSNDSAEKTAGRYAVEVMTTKPGVEGELLAQRGIEYEAVTYTEPTAGLTAGRPAMTAVNANSAHPDEAVKMLEVVNSDEEIFNILLWGVEDVNYTLEDGMVAQIENMGTGIQAWVIGNQFKSLLTAGQDPDVWAQTEEMNRSAAPNPLMGFSIDNTPVQEAVAAYSAAVAEYKNWFYEDDYRERYDEFVEKVREPLTIMLEEYQKQYDAWVAAQEPEEIETEEETTQE